MSTEQPQADREARVCLACGTSTASRFCGECGASLEVAPLSQQLRVDLAESLGWDGRFIRTLRDLLLHPVRVVTSYVRGERGRYVPPLRLFFGLAAIYIVALSLVQPNLYGAAMTDPARGSAKLQARIQASGLSIEQFTERVETRMNAIVPVVTALALLPVMVLLRLMQRQRSWHEHLLFLIGASNVAWLLGILVLPIAFLSSLAHGIVLWTVTLIAYAVPFWGIYPERSHARTTARFLVLMTVDVTAGILLTTVAFMLVAVSAVLF
jgi:hypothetical protein